MAKEIEEELGLPFFSRDSTKLFIDQLAHVESLSIFPGAGVTIDKTGLSWGALVAQLLEPGRDRQNAETLVRALGAQLAGSVAVQKYIDAHGTALDERGVPAWRRAIGGDLRGMLYAKGGLIGGRLSEAIGVLWVQLAKKRYPVSLLTTNFEEYIERDIREAITIWSRDLQNGTPTDKSPAELAAEADALADVELESLVLYLHGIVREDGPIQDLVISERDYFERATAVQQALVPEFGTKNVLIIGSSLTDRPLLNALLESREDAEARGLKRYAVIPRLDLGALDNSPESASIIRGYTTRLRHLGVEGAFVDHYSQVAQLLTEVGVAATLPVGSYKSSRKRYGERLRRWWEDWFSAIEAPENFKEIQESHHGELVKCLSDVKRRLGDPNEELRLELWLRWNPTDRGNLVLRLWASSYARFSAWEQTRDEAIASESRFASVNALCEGRVLYEQNRDASTRWKSFLAFPLEPDRREEIIPGAMVLSSMTGGEDSCLSEERRGRHPSAVQEALKCGAALTAVPIRG